MISAADFDDVFSCERSARRPTQADRATVLVIDAGSALGQDDTTAADGCVTAGAIWSPSEVSHPVLPIRKHTAANRLAGSRA